MLFLIAHFLLARTQFHSCFTFSAVPFKASKLAQALF
jgi:hypothetical protein